MILRTGAQVANSFEQRPAMNACFTVPKLQWALSPGRWPLQHASAGTCFLMRCPAGMTWAMTPQNCQMRVHTLAHLTLELAECRCPMQCPCPALHL